MNKALACIWLAALLVCLALAARHRGAWREFARSPAQIDGEVTGYADHSESDYAFRVAKQIFRGTDLSPEIGENMFVGRSVKVFFCASDPTVNALKPPTGEPEAYVKARLIGYVGNRMICITLVLAMIHLAVTRARDA